MLLVALTSCAVPHDLLLIYSMHSDLMARKWLNTAADGQKINLKTLGTDSWLSWSSYALCLGVEEERGITCCSAERTPLNIPEVQMHLSTYWMHRVLHAHYPFMGAMMWLGETRLTDWRILVSVCFRNRFKLPQDLWVLLHYTLHFVVCMLKLRLMVCGVQAVQWGLDTIRNHNNAENINK